MTCRQTLDSVMAEVIDFGSEESDSLVNKGIPTVMLYLVDGVNSVPGGARSNRTGGFPKKKKRGEHYMDQLNQLPPVTSMEELPAIFPDDLSFYLPVQNKLLNGPGADTGTVSATKSAGQNKFSKAAGRDPSFMRDAIYQAINDKQFVQKKILEIQRAVLEQELKSEYLGLKREAARKEKVEQRRKIKQEAIERMMKAVAEASLKKQEEDEERQAIRKEVAAVLNQMIVKCEYIMNSEPMQASSGAVEQQAAALADVSSAISSAVDDDLNSSNSHCDISHGNEESEINDMMDVDEAGPETVDGR